MKQFFCVIAAGMVIASCSDSKGNEKTTTVEGKETTTAVKKVTSKELNEDFDAAWNKKDSTHLFTLLADDIQMLSGKLHLNGKKEVMERFVRHNLPYAGNLKTTVVSRGDGADLAYETGMYTLDVTPPNTAPFVNKGNYNFVWKKDADDAWKVTSITMEDLPVEKK